MRQKNSQELLVGIGIPTYNRSSYLKLALDSFLSQTYRNIVIVICDNASTDDTRQICEEYLRLDKRIKYIRHEKNIGQNPNATFALHQIASIADLCTMTSDDDIADPEYLEACVNALIADDGAAMAITAHEWFFWGRERIIKRDPHLIIPSAKDLYGRLKQYILFYSHDERSFCMTGVYRKEIVINEEFENHYENDVNFCLRCLSRGYFLLATERVLFHKGTLPDRQLTRDMPFGFNKLKRGLPARMGRAASEFRNMAFLAKVSGLSFWQKIKLLFWDCTVVFRIFTQYKI